MLVTVALPPPIVWAPELPSAPMTATEPALEADSGRRPLFLSRTVPSSSPCSATWACAGVVTMAVFEPLGALSNMPNRNIWVSRRDTMVSSVVSLTWPSWTAWTR